jgi:hypothetical protein
VFCKRLNEYKDIVTELWGMKGSSKDLKKQNIVGEFISKLMGF